MKLIDWLRLGWSKPSSVQWLGRLPTWSVYWKNLKSDVQEWRSEESAQTREGKVLRTGGGAQQILIHLVFSKTLLTKLFVELLYDTLIFCIPASSNWGKMSEKKKTNRVLDLALLLLLLRISSLSFISPSLSTSPSSSPSPSPPLSLLFSFSFPFSFSCSRPKIATDNLNPLAEFSNKMCASGVQCFLNTTYFQSRDCAKLGWFGQLTNCPQ